MAIRDYLTIILRSAITKWIKKIMVIDHIAACIFYEHGRIATIAAGLRRSQQDCDDRSRIATIAAGLRRSQQDCDDRSRIATIAAGLRRSQQDRMGYSEIELQLFLYLGC